MRLEVHSRGLIGQQHELAVAVASVLPLAPAVLQVDAREKAAVKAERMAFVNDEVVELGLQPDRHTHRPNRFASSANSFSLRSETTQ